METSRIEGLTSFLVMDYLEKKGISPELTQKLQNELSKKGLFQSCLQLEGPPTYNSFQDLRSQFPESKIDILDNVVRNQYKITKERMSLKREKDHLIKETEEKYNIFDPKKRRDRLHRPKLKSNRTNVFNNFPPEIFTDCWNKFKSVFGHLRRDLDPEDPINGSPVYNLIYNKTGQYVISAADDGLIKIWSTVNGELVNTFIGHNADINATALSECGKYLASCSNDGIVRVWNLDDGTPIAVFNDHAEGRTVCSLNFFCIPQHTQSGKIMKTGFASASDDGSIKIYFEEDFINNKGIIDRSQKHMTLESGTLASKGFSSIEFHPEGFIAAGTNNGSVLIWNKLFEIDTRNIERHRIVKNEHSKDCHLTLWNKEGNRLITASFDGTAKIWPWICDNFLANKETKSIYVFDGELGKGSDIKCCAVAWSCRGRYAVASFCKKMGKKHEDNGIVQSNIQVYDSLKEKRLHKFDQTYDGATFENYIFILEAHPFNESILLSADYDGKIIIWDISIGVMLNCFVETCAHLGYPLLNAPILDGRFSPDGLGFSIASYYGSVSLYGYGDKDLFMTTPIEQFYSKEFLEFEIDQDTFKVISLHSGQEMHLAERGALCSAKKQEYRRSLQDDRNEFDEVKYYEKYVEAVETKRHSSLQDNSQNSSIDCVKSLKKHLKEKIHEEIHKRLEKYYSSLIEKGKFGTMAHFVSHDKIIESRKDEKGNNLKRLTRGGTQATQPNQVTLQPQTNINDFMFESDYDPISDDEPEVIQPRRSRRARNRSRRQQEMDEGVEEEQFEEINEIKKQSEDDDEEELLYGEERKEGQEKKTRRLLIEDDEEEEQLFHELRRPEGRYDVNGHPSIITRQRAAISGRRNRDFVNSSAMSQRQSLNPTLSSLRSGRTRAPVEEVIEEALCTRCGLENARQKCSQSCGRIYHPDCARRQGRDSELGIFSCFFCVLKRKKGEKVIGDKLNREWCGEDLQIPGFYVPQAGDQVTYIFQAHEEFILKHFDVLRYKKKEVFPFEKIESLRHDNVCKVTKIKYSFPYSSKKTHKGQYSVLMKVVLEVQEPAIDRGKTFQVSFFRSSVSDFLIPRAVYTKSISLIKQLKKDIQIRFKYSEGEKLGFLSDISPNEPEAFPNSQWCCLHLFDHSEEGTQTRKSRSSQSVLNVSPWDIIFDEDIHTLTIDQDLNEDYIEKLHKDIEKLENSDPEFVPFIEEVDKRTYSHYLLMIPFEMNISKIKSRLLLLFYRHKAAIIDDVRQIRINCVKFNQEEAVISRWAEKLERNLLQLVDGNLDVSNLKRIEREPQPQPTKSRSQKNKLLIEEEDDEEVENHEKEDESDIFDDLEEQEYGEEERVKTRTTRTRRATRNQEPVYDDRFNESSNSNNFANSGNPEYKTRLRHRGKREDLNEDHLLDKAEDDLNQKSGIKLKLTRKATNNRAKYEFEDEEFGVTINENGKKEEEYNGQSPQYKTRLRNKKRNFTSFFEQVDDEVEEQYLEEKKKDNSEFFSQSEDLKLEDEFKEDVTKIRITRSRTKEHVPKAEQTNHNNTNNNAHITMDDYEARRYPSRSTRSKNPMLG